MSQNIPNPFVTSELRDTSQELQELRKQLAASQAREQQLREALERKHDSFRALMEWCVKNVKRWSFPEWDSCSYAISKMEQALAAPSDTTALEAMIAKAAEVMRERSMNACSDRSIGTDPDDFDAWDHCNYSCADAIRALPGVRLEDLK